MSSGEQTAPAPVWWKLTDTQGNTVYFGSDHVRSVEVNRFYDAPEVRVQVGGADYVFTEAEARPVLEHFDGKVFEGRRDLALAVRLGP